jgi:hypothetical protein
VTDLKLPKTELQLAAEKFLDRIDWSKFQVIAGEIRYQDVAGYCYCPLQKVYGKYMYSLKAERELGDVVPYIIIAAADGEYCEGHSHTTKEIRKEMLKRMGAAKS